MAVRWSGFTGWAVAGGLFAIGVAALLSIGVFVLVVATALAVLLAGRGGVWPDALGLLVGVAVATLVLVEINS